MKLFMKLSMKLSNSLKRKTNKHYNHLKKYLAKRGMFLKAADYIDMYEVHLMLKKFAFHIGLYKNPPCFFSFTLDFDALSITILSFHFSTSYLHY